MNDSEMSARERWTSEAWIIDPSGELFRLAISLDDDLAQRKTIRESIGGPARRAVSHARGEKYGHSVFDRLEGGLLWSVSDEEAVVVELPLNVIASRLAGGATLGRAVLTGEDEHGRVAPVGVDLLARLVEECKRFRVEPGA
jgi:hypothetical protein